MRSRPLPTNPSADAPRPGHSASEPSTDGPNGTPTPFPGPQTRGFEGLSHTAYLGVVGMSRFAQKARRHKNAS